MNPVIIINWLFLKYIFLYYYIISGVLPLINILSEGHARLAGIWPSQPKLDVSWPSLPKLDVSWLPACQAGWAFGPAILNWM